ncbi:MAPEG family protein [Sandarakinorhabdus sp.]|uniref:MAPEG family protein n=1 Tax=Sandarakinorhabdus sp. TaxID=1916663 RepID=UPI0035648112
MGAATSNIILLPMLVLAGWTMIVWVWMYATRLPAMGRAGIDGTKMVGSTGKSLRDQLVAAGEERASWVADNYNHLMEQPTIFYAVTLALAVMGEGGGLAVGLAWGYAGLRIAHSLVQILSNRVVVRFALFALASLCLLGLVLLALSIASAQG